MFCKHFYSLAEKYAKNNRKNSLIIEIFGLASLSLAFAKYSMLRKKCTNAKYQHENHYPSKSTNSIILNLLLIQLIRIMIPMNPKIVIPKNFYPSTT